MTYLIFLLGVFVGTFCGILILGLCAAAADADKWSERRHDIVCPSCDRWLTLEEASARRCRCGVKW